MEKIKKFAWVAAVVLLIGIVCVLFYYSQLPKPEEEEQVPNGVQGHFSGTDMEVADNVGSETVLEELHAEDSLAMRKASLYEQGLELITLMQEMAGNDTYMSLYSSSTELQEIISVVAEGDYSAPKEVYKITIDEKLLLSLGGEVSMDGMSEQLQEYMCARLYASIATQLNARLGGANVLAAASICTASKTFVNSEITENMIYLYTYENAKPVVITFIPGEDNTVSASGYFILCEEPETDTLEELKEYLDVFAGTIEVVEENRKN